MSTENISNQQTLTEAESAERFQIINYTVQTRKLEKLWRAITSRGIEPILIKGWAAAQYYPQPARRLFTDVDLVVSPEKFDKALNLEIGRGGELDQIIDWHSGARHLDSLPFAALFDNSLTKICGETPVRVLCDEDHLRILCVHWLTDGGEYFEKLDDIYYLIENRHKNFDWSKCLDRISVRRRRWITLTIAIAAKYRKLDVSGLPFADEIVAEKIPAWVSATLEREWSQGTRMIPLDLVRHNRKQLWQQLKKRFPPNPIQAIVLEDGDFDRYPRAYYQFRNIFNRMPSPKKSLKRLRENL